LLHSPSPSKTKVFYQTPKKGSEDIEKHPNTPKVWKKNLRNLKRFSPCAQAKILFSPKPCLSSVQQKKVSWENTKLLEFRIKPLWFYMNPCEKPRGLIRNSKVFVFFYESFFVVQNLKKGFGEKRIFTWAHEKNLLRFRRFFFRLWTYLGTFRHLRSLFWEFGKIPSFTVYFNNCDTYYIFYVFA